MWRVLLAIVEYVLSVWFWAGGLVIWLPLLGRRPPRLVTRTFFELRPFIPVPLTVDFAILLASDRPLWLTWIRAAVYLCTYAVLLGIKDDDDDRWKRRRRWLKDKVARVGARLVVAPALGGQS